MAALKTAALEVGAIEFHADDKVFIYAGSYRANDFK